MTENSVCIFVKVCELVNLRIYHSEVLKKSLNRFEPETEALMIFFYKFHTIVLGVLRLNVAFYNENFEIVFRKCDLKFGYLQYDTVIQQ